MGSNNYFKVGHTFYFFDDRVPSSINDAFVKACMDAHPIVVFRMPRVLGPWRHVQVVGHRSEEDIRKDIRAAERGALDLDMGALQDELSALRAAVGVII